MNEASFLQPTWLKPGQSLRDYLKTARQPENAPLAANRIQIDKNVHPHRNRMSQMGHKTATKHLVQSWQGPQRRHMSISRMTPAPTDHPYEQGVVMPGWGLSDDIEILEQPPPQLKRGREPEPPKPRFLDLRTVRNKKHVNDGSQPQAGSSGRRVVYRKQVPEVDELDRRLGGFPQKKKSAVVQVAYKSVHKPFDKRLAAATQFRGEEQSAAPRVVHSKPSLSQRTCTQISAARKCPVATASPASDDAESVLSLASGEEDSYEEEIDELDSSSSGGSESWPRFDVAQTQARHWLPSASSSSGNMMNSGNPIASPAPPRRQPDRYRSLTIEDSSGEDSDGGTNPGHTAPQLRSAQESIRYRSQTIDASDEGEGPNLGPPLTPLKLAESESRMEERITTPTLEPEPLIQLFRAFQLHTLPTDIFQEAKQLPFLARNVRKSFRLLCCNGGVPMTPLPEDRKGTVLVRYEHVAKASFERPVPKWFCPLCNLHSKFARREMLAVHLKRDHQEMFIEWLRPTEDEIHDGVSWRLHVLIPEIDDQAIGSADRVAREVTPDPVSESMTVSPTPEHPTDVTDPVTISPPMTPQVRITVLPLTPGVHDDPTGLFPCTPPPAPRRSIAPVTPATSPKAFKPKPPKAALPEPRPPQYPRPPPSSNRLGAAARKPYLPAKSTFGGPDIYYSIRPAGPCLLDLLGLLPLEPFGIFDGMVLEREEEIYNDDELPDEEKAIIALWARWILLNKVKFEEDRAGSVKMFIDEYWRMIHLAAGWQALVYQLHVLAAWRLLKHHEIIPLVEHYEELVGAEFWDDWDSNEE